MELIIFVVAVALLGLLAQAWGVDSRVVDLDPAHPTSLGLR
ncbi:MAG TPA: hypothetical protein VFI34_11380 [Candidatus Limnocylindrales bacterium]|nr:hypothetical protein [Candidatus Limnocylindrales bacterium]